MLVGWAIMVMIDDYKNRGVFLDLSLMWSLFRDTKMVSALWASSIVWSIVTAVFEEYLLCSIKMREWPFVITIYMVNQSVLLIVPPAIAISRGMAMSPLLRGALMTQIFVLAMKHHSYFMTNRYLRKDNPHHHSLSSMGKLAREYFTFFYLPTLVYELEYPRRNTSRPHYIAKELFSSFLCFLVMYLISTC